MNAPYFLAIDIGTSRTSAAIARSAPDGSLLATPFPLGRSSDNAPTVVFVADGELLFGDAAERRGHTQPDRLIREYKRSEEHTSELVTNAHLVCRLPLEK